MSDTARTRKDGRVLYFDHPVRPEEFIELVEEPELSPDATACRRDPDLDEAWMYEDRRDTPIRK